MKRELAVIAVVAAMVVAPAASLAASRFVPPRWLPSAERSLLVRAFGGAKPVRTHYISYPKKIAVVFEFSHVVICGMCSSPTAESQPRGKVVRVSFDRRTHQLSGASDGCDSAKSEEASLQRASVFVAERGCASVRQHTPAGYPVRRPSSEPRPEQDAPAQQACPTHSRLAFFSRSLAKEEAAVMIRGQGKSPIVVRGPGSVRRFGRWKQMIFVDLRPVTVDFAEIERELLGVIRSAVVAWGVSVSAVRVRSSI